MKTSHFLPHILSSESLQFHCYITCILQAHTMTRMRAEDSQLIDDLHRLSKKSPKLVRSTVYTAPSDPSISVRSWKMNEFKYYDVPSPFPTLARGLFSRELPRGDDPNGEQKYQIVARGYDKFFNIGEVPWTDVSCLHVTPPDIVSLEFVRSGQHSPYIQDPHIRYHSNLTDASYLLLPFLLRS